MKEAGFLFPGWYSSYTGDIPDLSVGLVTLVAKLKFNTDVVWECLTYIYSLCETKSVSTVTAGPVMGECYKGQLFLYFN